MKARYSIAAASALIAGVIGTAALAKEPATVAFLLPDQASTRYEEHDFPGFQAAMKELCADCTVIYQNANANANANADAALQQQQVNSVITQGAKIVVLDPGGQRRRGRSGTDRAKSGRQDHRL